MNVRLRSVVTGAAALAIAGGSLVGLAGTAFAANPGWEPDALNEAGTLTLYDASGNVLTGGTNLSHIADFAAANGAKQDPGVTKATLFFAAPDHTKPDPSTWTTNGAVSPSSNFPNAAAPAPLTGPGFTNPLVTIGAAGANLTAWLGGVTQDSTAGYANIYQLRILESGPGGVAPTSYWAADIQVSGTTWSLVYPSIASSSTALAVTPTSPQTVGFGNATLTATVTPASATGTVKFFDGATQVGTTQTLAGGTASVVATAPALGTHPYTAVFSSGSGTLSGSTSPVSNFVVQAPAIGTTTALSANPSTQTQFAPVVLTANITEADAPTTAGLAGSVAFFNGATNLGAGVPDATPGEYKLTTSALPVGVDNITATFTPTSSAYNGSTSSAVPVTITASACPGQPDPSGATCSDPQAIQVSVGAGSLTITTPYTAASPYVLPDLQLNAAGTLLTSSAQFPKAGDPLIVVHSSLAGNPNWTVSVLATDLTSGTNLINGDNLGLTGGALFGAGFPGTVSFTDIPAGLGLAPAAVSTAGLKGNGTPHTFAQSAGGGNGSASMFGTLSLNAPTSTVAGTYNGTITFSVA